jgi:ribosomal protein S18 acetylase RimI-like enzyme
MSPQFVVGPYLEADEPVVTSLWNEVFADDPPWNEPSAVIRNKLQVQRDLFLVGTLGERVVATVMAGFDGFRGWVYHLAVVPGERRKGYGAAMMREAEKRLLAIGCPKVNLQIRATNTGAVAFYHELGYVVEDRASMGKLLEERR